jgi:hypothetical protein
MAGQAVTGPCVAPGCTSAGETVFIADAAGRLAGRDWVPGDVIELCWPHAMDVYHTIGVTDQASVAEWLRPGAADPPNTWNAVRAQW